MSHSQMKKTRVTLYLREGDMENLRSIYPDLGASIIIRELVAAHVDRMLASKAPAPEVKDLTL